MLEQSQFNFTDGFWGYLSNLKSLLSQSVSQSVSHNMDFRDASASKNHSTAFRKCQSKGKIKFKALKKISNVDETNPDDWEQRNPIWFNLVEKEMYPNSQAPLLVQQQCCAMKVERGQSALLFSRNMICKNLGNTHELSQTNTAAPSERSAAQ